VPEFLVATEHGLIGTGEMNVTDLFAEPTRARWICTDDKLRCHIL